VWCLYDGCGVCVMGVRGVVDVCGVCDGCGVCVMGVRVVLVGVCGLCVWWVWCVWCVCVDDVCVVVSDAKLAGVPLVYDNSTFNRSLDY
jgi:hypothetical protein